MILHSTGKRRAHGGGLNFANALQMKRFHDSAPMWRRCLRKISARGVATVLVLGLAAAYYVFGLVQQSGFMVSMHEFYLAEKNKELQERETEIARIVAMQYASPRDIVEIGKAINTVLSTAQNAKQRTFLEQALPFALHMQVQKRIPASALVAQAIYESAYGASELAKKYHNYFGMKAGSGWDGDVAEDQKTRDSGVLVRADFRAYPSLEEGFRGYSEKMASSRRYRPAFQYSRGDLFVAKLLECGYCPDSDYLGNIRMIIARHKLNCLENLLQEARQAQAMPLLSQAAPIPPSAALR